jgi:hypothetical protein
MRPEDWARFNPGTRDPSGNMWKAGLMLHERTNALMIELIRMIAAHYAGQAPPAPSRWAATPGPEEASGSTPSQLRQAAMATSAVPQRPFPRAAPSPRPGSPAALGVRIKEPDRKGKQRAVDDSDEEEPVDVDEEDNYQHYPPRPPRDDDPEDFGDSWGGVTS